MGYDETNRRINDRIHEIASNFSTNNATEREKNELAVLIYPKLKYHIWKFCNNIDDTEESLQWTLKRIFNNISNFNFNKGRFTTWIYTIAKNETLFYLYKKGRNRLVYTDEEYGLGYQDSCEYDSESELEMHSLYEKTIDEISMIDDISSRNIAIDKMINHQKVKNIAIKYNINENTVKTKLRKVRYDIRDKIIEKNPHFKETLNAIFEI
jgi:DNA-directed RNA polymerase specialized sigma24 family protein